MASAHHEVHLARRERDGTAVVLKTYPYPAPGVPPAGAAREFEILRSLRPGTAPTALAFEDTGEHLVLVLENVAGSSSQRALELPDFLNFAIQAAHALSDIHASRVVHQNLCPDNFLFDRERQSVRILGFSRAAPLGAPNQHGAEGAFDCPLLHMAPEQTGRLERGVDFRTDLYALGATLYELSTGRPPFDARDPIDLIHAHIAQRARPPVEIAPGFSGTLSRILMKLLEKEPEDRYQTADALRVDLETCREQLERTGEIDDALVLATTDAPYRPLFRRRIYGRDAECESLQRAYRRAADGNAGLLLVCGAPGIGKSALVPELHRPLALDGGYLVRGKFDLYRGHLPYAGFVNALSMLLRQIATESEPRKQQWRRALDEGMGRLTGVTAELVPELGELLGPLPPVPALEPRETQRRLALAVRRFVLAAARQARPLVLFLDDLQWADAGSLYLLGELLDGGEQAPLLVIGSYRDNEVGPEHPLRRRIEQIQNLGMPIETCTLGPLSDAAACEMLADALGHPPDEVTELAARVTRLGGNNPLLIQQCVYHLHELGCIRFTKNQGWTWDLEVADAAAIPEDPVGMMLAKLQRLRGETRSVAQFASCVGDEFDVELLAELSHQPQDTLEGALYELAEEGLIAPCRAGFRFVHDRIREAAQALLPAQQRAQLHLRTATLLLEGLSLEKQEARCFEIADHLARASGHIPEDMRLRALDWHRRAGLAALRSGASATAEHYLDAALALFGDDDWQECASLGFELHLLASDCAYQVREFERALARLAPLERRTFDSRQRALVAAQHVKICAVSRPVSETIERTLASFREAGRRLPLYPSRLRVLWEVARTDWALHGPPEGWNVGRDASTAPAWLPIFRAASTSISRVSLGLEVVCCAGAVRHGLRQDSQKGLGLRIGGYATYRRAFLGSSRGARQYADAAQYWADRDGDPSTAARAAPLIQCLRGWTAPRRTVVEPLRTASQRLQELGEVEWAMLASLVAAHHLAFSGGELVEVLGAYDALPHRDHLTPLESPPCFAEPYRALSEGEDVGARFEQSRPDLARFRSAAQIAAVHWMVALCTEARFEDAWWVSELVSTSIWEINAGPSHLTDYAMFRGLTAAHLSGETRGRRGWALRRIARRCERMLRRWARHGPDFVHMAMLVRAARAQSRGPSARALELYERAAAAARTAGYVQHAALALERGAELLDVLDRAAEAREMRARAAEFYRAWGARAKADRL